MAKSKLSTRSVAAEICKILDSPEVAMLIAELEATRWTGRPGYRIRSQIGAVLVKGLYCIPFWSRTIRFVEEHQALREAIGCTGSGEPDGVPSEDSLRRFREKLMDHGDILENCLDQVVASLKEQNPEMGTDLAIDASDMPAYANGQRDIGEVKEPKRFSDSDATWGRRSAISTRKGGSFYGYRLHLSVCVATGLPVSWLVEPANVYEGWQVASLLDEARRRGAIADTAALDKGYDDGGVHTVCAERNCLPVIPLRQTTAVKRGDHKPPSCDHGEWTFGGSDRKRGASKWRCPTKECKPASTWIEADRMHPLIPYKSKRWNSNYRKRVAVEREFGRLKHDYGLAPMRTRGLERVKLHADLTILARLSSALARARSDTIDQE